MSQARLTSIITESTAIFTVIRESNRFPKVASFLSQMRKNCLNRQIIEIEHWMESRWHVSVLDTVLFLAANDRDSMLTARRCGVPIDLAKDEIFWFDEHAPYRHQPKGYYRDRYWKKFMVTEAQGCRVNEYPLTPARPKKEAV